MTNYEKAYKELYEAVQGTDDQALRLQALNRRESLLNEIEQHTQQEPKEQTTGLTKNDILSIKDPQKRIQAIRENESLFKGAN